MSLAKRNSIVALEEEMKKAPQLDIAISHAFADGLYARTMHMPKDALVIGKIHLQEHFCIISKGKALVSTEKGKVTVEAPYIFKSNIGDKRAIFALEDIVWTTVHATTETDIAVLEASFVAEAYTKEVLKLMEN